MGVILRFRTSHGHPAPGETCRYTMWYEPLDYLGGVANSKVHEPLVIHVADDPGFRPCQVPGQIGMGIKSDNPYMFKPGTWGVIREVRLFTPTNGEPRWCYRVHWEGGQHDWWPVADGTANYQFRWDPP